MIFVSVACHDDVDVIPTCKDLFAKAARPLELRVVVILQTDRPELFEELKEIPQVETHVFPLSWATGVGKPRALACKLIVDEEYFLQIDCHLRFQHSWDETLMSELAACPEKSVLTSFLPGFVIATGELLSMTPRAPKLWRFIGSVPVSSMEDLPDDLPAPPQVAHLAASMIFCKIGAILAAPPDPYYHYYGEELSQTLRLWTRGYDCYAIRQCIAHHAWRGENPRTGADNVDDVMKYWRSMQRIDALLGNGSARSQHALIDLEAYGLGTERSVESWEARFGVNLAKKTIS